jgi:hypothetical protein
MEAINVFEDFRFFRHDYSASSDWETPPFDGENYCSLVVFLGGILTQQERARLADELIETNCRVVHTWGTESTTFDGEVSQRTINRYGQDSVLDDNGVMATSHVGEPIGDALWAFLYCSEHGEVAMRNFLILLIGHHPQIETELCEAIRKEMDECASFWSCLPEDMKAKWLELSRKKNYKKSR